MSVKDVCLNGIQSLNTREGLEWLLDYAKRLSDEWGGISLTLVEVIADVDDMVNNPAKVLPIQSILNKYNSHAEEQLEWLSEMGR